MGLRQIVEVVDSDQNFVSMVSYDFTKKQTWYQGSTRVTGETLTNTLLLPLKFSSVNQFWIDLTHGLVTGEDDVSAPYVPVIKVNGTVVTTGFTIDYRGGCVTFTSPPGGTVTADYSWASSSLFKITPPTGKILSIKRAELQFSTDVVLKPTYFNVWAANGTVNLGTVAYKNMKDVMNISNGGIVLPQFDSMLNSVVIFPFNYVRPIKLQASLAMDLRLTILNDEEMTGEFGTVTFYTVIEDA